MAKTTMQGFSKRIREIAVGVEANSGKMVRKTVITVASAVALRTPVDTGRARANWRTQVGSALTAQAGAFPQGTKGSTGAAAAAQATAEAVNAMQGPVKSGVPVFISNNLPYIGRLNDGSSTQAPAGFIQSAIDAGIRAIHKSRLVK